MVVSFLSINLCLFHSLIGSLGHRRRHGAVTEAGRGRWPSQYECVGSQHHWLHRPVFGLIGSGGGISSPPSPSGFYSNPQHPLDGFRSADDSRLSDHGLPHVSAERDLPLQLGVLDHECLLPNRSGPVSGVQHAIAQPQRPAETAVAAAGKIADQVARSSPHRDRPSERMGTIEPGGSDICPDRHRASDSGKWEPLRSTGVVELTIGPVDPGLDSVYGVSQIPHVWSHRPDRGWNGMPQRLGMV